MTTTHSRKASIQSSLANYYHLCFKELKLLHWAIGWFKGFLDEIIRSRVNQVSLVLGAIGISGVVAASFTHLVGHPSVPLFAVAGGVFIFIVLAIHDCAKRRQMAQPTDNNLSEQRLTQLLQLFRKEERAMLRSEIAPRLNLTTEEMDQVLVFALSEHWIEQVGEFFRLREEMKAVAFQRIKKQQQENHDA
uniref:Uncharacterized protein n=1 Tax=Candidatus Kentrum sp. LPFa TaxID=2126335 RepID=A0A450W4Q2_9GAMM|nr:MAG: hypothetical protein BECKLPF1236A_GA0070988_1006315 [Candidatus Kentron sp. LPFa]VFK28030.1 MAG: hypothetical protein BECKLPF1236C_GA0070990_1005615 [Candidatus Kentron sp. LPFa]